MAANNQSLIQETLINRSYFGLMLCAMKLADASSLMTKEVTDPQAIEYLTNPKNHRDLQPFLRRACLIKDAALELGINQNLMYRRVQRLLALGLIGIAKKESRGGRELCLYKSTADVFTIALTNTSLEQVLDIGQQYLAQRFLYTMMKQFAKNPQLLEHGFIRVVLNHHQQVEHQVHLAQQEQAFNDLGLISSFSALKLSRANHELLRQELHAVYNKYRQFEDNNEISSLLFVALTRTV
jgi:hypothetical protein